MVKASRSSIQTFCQAILRQKLQGNNARFDTSIPYPYRDQEEAEGGCYMHCGQFCGADALSVFFLSRTDMPKKTLPTVDLDLNKFRETNVSLVSVLAVCQREAVPRHC
jgi:hypothetical protein